MELNQLRIFVVLAEELHFARAAERLGMAQPPLSQLIQRMEKSLGCALFLRSSRRTDLTPAGRELLTHATEVLRSYEYAVERTRSTAHGETGLLRVGTPPSMMLTGLPGAIRKYRARYPKVDFVLKETSTSKIAEGLLAGTLDAGFLREFDPPKALQLEWVWNEPLVAVIPSGHPLAKQVRLTLSALAKEPFVLFPRTVGVAFYDRLIDYCVRAGFSPRVVQEATQWQSIVTCVETGMGVSIAPACVQRFRWPGVEYRPLGLKTAVVACRSAASGEPAVAFLRLAREALPARA